MHLLLWSCNIARFKSSLKLVETRKLERFFGDWRGGREIGVSRYYFDLIRLVPLFLFEFEKYYLKPKYSKYILRLRFQRIINHLKFQAFLF